MRLSGESIRRIRTALKEDQTRFGARFGAHRRTVIRWEKLGHFFSYHYDRAFRGGAYVNELEELHAAYYAAGLALAHEVSFYVRWNVRNRLTGRVMLLLPREVVFLSEQQARDAAAEVVAAGGEAAIRPHVGRLGFV